MLTTDLITLIAFALGIIAIVVLTARYRWHAFTTIFFVTATIGLASGLTPKDVLAYIVNDFGEMLGYIAIVVVSGIIIGEFLDKTGAALTISQTVLRLVGNPGQRWSWASQATSWWCR